jgi:tyrosyl-tRNA synthetase
MTTLSLLKEHVEIMLPEAGLQQKLALNRPLVIKLGFDPTAPDLHLGHAVVLKKLKQFQDLGHQIVIIVGSFTAQIGDPTGKNKSRKPLSKEEVLANADTYIQQLSKVIDVDKCQIHFNGDWLDGLTFKEILQLLSKVTVAQLMHRNDFNKRFTENTPIAMHELMYPILQGFDSMQIKADIEMGGTDQLFNCTMGRQLQEAHGMEPQIVMCMPLLKGLDGKEKMSKSLNNIIGLTDAPNEMFGKVMSIPDALIPEFLELATDFTEEELHELKKIAHPMDLKKIIGKNIITQYHHAAAAEAAEQFFVQQFQNKVFDEKSFEPLLISELGIIDNNITLVELCHLIKKDETKSAIRRLINGGGVLVNNEKVLDPNQVVTVENGMRLKLGKRLLVELVE